MVKLTTSVSTYPARVSLAWYLALVMVGGLLLSLPACQNRSRGEVGVLDATFTATSAVCVTGLAVKSTVRDFSGWGQLVILVLIQLGGIGIMTVTTFVSLNFGRPASLRQRAVLADTLGAEGVTDLTSVLRRVFWYTFVIEGLGFVLLALHNILTQMPIIEALWHAAFHSISAFCNAGFALSDQSLVDYRGNYYVNFVIMGLMLAGGIGFPVMLDLRRHWRGGWGVDWSGLHLHSKIMLIGTAVLLFLATLAFLLLEWNGVLADLDPLDRVLAAFFHSASCRTAGFNTIQLNQLTQASLFVIILLMMIGGGPCSTAGGVKISTISLLILRAHASFQGKRTVNLFRRTIPESVIQRAVATLMVFGVIGIVALLSLLVAEHVGNQAAQSHERFLVELFEVVSALGTVGLSLGITPELTAAGKIVIVVLMFVGRLGPITVFVALARDAVDQVLEYPNEEPLVG